MTTEELIKALREKTSRDNRALLDEAADQLELAQMTIVTLVEERIALKEEVISLNEEMSRIKWQISGCLQKK
jgi:hypothetical protein